MNQNHIKFYCSDSICIEQIDNFFLDKSIIKPEAHKESILFSALINNKNKSFKDKLLLNFFPELVEKVIEEEFGKKLDTELIDILIKDFNFKAFENFSLPSKARNSTTTNNSSNGISEEKASYVKDSDAHLLLKDSSGSPSVFTSHPSNALLTSKKETEELDKIQKLFASQKPTEPKLNNALKDAEKSEKEISNSNNAHVNKNVNIKEQKIIFFNKQQKKENEGQLDDYLSNNENLNPNRQFNFKSKAHYKAKSKGDLGYANRVEAGREEFKVNSDNFDLKNLNLMDVPETKPSDYKSKEEYFYNPVVNENAFYYKHSQKNYKATRGFIPRFQYYKRCKKAMLTQTEWNRLWWSTEKRANKSFGKDDA